MELSLPLKGVCQGFNPDQLPEMTTDYMNNVVPVDTLERRVRLGQRPGLDKVFSQQVGGSATPVVLVGQVTVLE